MNTQAKILLVAGLATAGLAAGFFAVNAQSESRPRMEHMRGAFHDGDRPGPGEGMGRGPGPGFGPGMARHAGMMGGPPGMAAALCHPHRDALLAGVIAYGEKRLDITPAQSEAWNRLTTALRAGGTRAEQSCAAARPEDRPANSTERLARMETRMGDGLAIVQTIRPAYEAFYATLSDAQKKTLEDMLSHRMARPDGRGDRHGHRGHRDRHGHDRQDKDRG